MRLGQLQTSIVLDRLICHDEGPIAERNTQPFLWAVFFKVDGDSAAIDGAGFTLSGAAVVRPAMGSHGNLAAFRLNTGDVVPIPAAIGRFSTVLQPIPVSDAIQALGAPAQVPGVVGVLCLLMEEDPTGNRVSDDGLTALNSAVRAELNRIVDRLSVLNQQPSPEDVDAVAGRIRDAIAQALHREGGFVQDLLGLVTAGDVIGAQLFLFTHAQLAPATDRPLCTRFRTEKAGDWEIRGRVTALHLPPTDQPPRPAGMAPVIVYGAGHTSPARGIGRVSQFIREGTERYGTGTELHAGRP